MMRRLILILVVACGICLGANAASTWERTGGKIQTERIDIEGPEIRVSEGYVYVTTTRTWSSFPSC